MTHWPLKGGSERCGRRLRRNRKRLGRKKKRVGRLVRNLHPPESGRSKGMGTEAWDGSEFGLSSASFFFFRVVFCIERFRRHQPTPRSNFIYDLHHPLRRRSYNSSAITPHPNGHRGVPGAGVIAIDRHLDHSPHPRCSRGRRRRYLQRPPRRPIPAHHDNHSAASASPRILDVGQLVILIIPLFRFPHAWRASGRRRTCNHPLGRSQFLLFLSYYVEFVEFIHPVCSDEIYEEKTTARQRRSQRTF